MAIACSKLATASVKSPEFAYETPSFCQAFWLAGLSRTCARSAGGHCWVMCCIPVACSFWSKPIIKLDICTNCATRRRRLAQQFLFNKTFSGRPIKSCFLLLGQTNPPCASPEICLQPPFCLLPFYFLLPKQSPKISRPPARLAHTRMLSPARRPVSVAAASTAFRRPLNKRASGRPSPVFALRLFIR